MYVNHLPVASQLNLCRLEKHVFNYSNYADLKIGHITFHCPCLIEDLSSNLIVAPFLHHMPVHGYRGGGGGGGG